MAPGLSRSVTFVLEPLFLKIGEMGAGYVTAPPGADWVHVLAQ